MERLVVYLLKYVSSPPISIRRIEGYDGEMRCPNCGSTKMLLIRIWSKQAGLVYELMRDGVSPTPVVASEQKGMSLGIGQEQLAFAF